MRQLESTIQSFWNRYQISFDHSDPKSALTNLVNKLTAGFDIQTQQSVWIRAQPVTQFQQEDLYRYDLEQGIAAEVVDERFLAPFAWGILDDLIVNVCPAVGTRICPHWHSESLVYDGQLPCDLRRSLSITRDIARACAALHHANSIAGHIRLSNVAVESGNGFLLSAGPEEYRRSEARSNEQSLEFALFASPEAAGSIEYDLGPSSDLYSLGVLLYTLLAGHPPFVGDSIGNIIFQHVACDPKLERLPDHTPPCVHDVLLRLLKKEPRDRYQQATALVDDLNWIIDSLDGLKSFSELVIGRSDVRSSVTEPSLVGRQRELSLVNETLSRIADGAGGSIAVTCPSGIGKSRFVLEVIRQSAARGFTIFKSLASNQASEIPTAPLLSIVEQITVECRRNTELRRRLKGDLIEAQDEISNLFPELADVIGWPQSQYWTRNELGKTHVEIAFCQILSSIGTTSDPCLIWIDDCQWLDGQSQTILEQLRHRSSSNTLFVFSCRSEHENCARFLDLVRPDQTLVLSTLSDNEIGALIESMAGQLPMQAVQTVTELAAGSPFMASAILRGMVESEALIHRAEQWVVDNDKIAKIQASSNAAEALVLRLQNIPQPVLELLTTAAVLGKEFDDLTISKLSGNSTVETRKLFQWAREQRLIWAMPNGRLMFVHDKIRESLLAGITAEHRKFIHLAFANFLQECQPENAFELAFQFGQAARFQEALPYALKAAETAQRLNSLEKAEELLRIALKGIDPQNRDLNHQVVSQLGRVLMLAGQYAEAQLWLERSLESANTPYETARIEMELGELAFKRGDKEQAVQSIANGLKRLGYLVPNNKWVLGLLLAKEIGTQILHTLFPKWFVGTKRTDPTETEKLVWRLHSRIAHGFWYTRDKFSTFWAHLSGLNRSERFPPTLELAQAYSEHAPAMSLIPWHNRGIKYAVRSLLMREELNDLWGQGQSRDFYSILLYSSSQFEKCITQATHAEQILLRTGDYWEVNIARYQLAAALYRRGDLKGALDLAQRTYQAALSIGDFQSTGNIIDVWVRAGLCQLPEEILNAEISRKIRDTQSQCQMLLAEGIQLFGKERYWDAARCFETAIRKAEKAGVVNTFVTPNYPWLATALRRQLEANPPRTRVARRRAFRKLLKVTRRAVSVSRYFQNELPHSLREMGMAHACVGYGRSARRALQKSMQVAEHQKAEYELAMTWKAYGQLGTEFLWPAAGELLAKGVQRINEIRQSVHKADAADSLSMLDRFDTILVAGRQIISANTPEQIFEQTTNAAQRLLRGQRASVIELQLNGTNRTWKNVHGTIDADQDLLNQTCETQKTAVAGQEQIELNGQVTKRPGTYLASPIVVHGQIVACLYVANELVSGLFGENEIRIADYLATTTGGALEKADGFRQLEKLNISLEQKVRDRTAAVEARSHELEITANELLATQSKLEMARDEAEAANSAKSDFLARISHEIRTPISAIMGFTELILRGVISNPTERNQKLETIHANSVHLLQLINDLLDLSKIEADRMEVEAIDCNPIRILHDVVTSLQVRADQKFIGLTMELIGDNPCRITSDPTRLRQILINIIGNAIKFTSQGGVTVSMTSIDGQLSFAIRDTGIGMTPTQQEKVFDPFTQADSSVTRKFGGTGLGLSISKQLAEALGGGISLRSELGVGSEFRITLPTGLRKPQDLISSETAWESLSQVTNREFNQVDLTGMRVLVVDDTETNRELLKIVIQNAGATVECLEDGLAAVTAIREGRLADVILMDMQMPVMDGYTATTNLRADGYEIPIIALTANSMVGDDQRCRDAGCSDYLSKPIDLDLLVEKLARIHGTDIIKSKTSIETTEVGSVERKFLASEKTARTWLDEVPDDEILRDFAIEFAEKVESQLDDLNELIISDRFVDLAAKAHWIKGTGGTVGLPTFTRLGSELEAASKAHDGDSIRRMIAEIEAFTRTSNELKGTRTTPS